MAMPYRYQEILQVLKNNQQGLTTRQVLTECRKIPGSEMPDDNGIVSKCIYALRSGKNIMTSDAIGGSIHKITLKGISALMAELHSDDEVRESDAPQKPIVLKKEEIADQLLFKNNEEKMNSDIFTLDPKDPVDAAMIEIRSAIIEAQKPVVIERKQEKIDTLVRLGNLMSDDIKVIFRDIASDIERLTAE